MSAQLAAYGRLGADPIARTSSAGKPWATASIAIALSDDDGASPQWFGVVAFGRIAEELCRSSKGDLVSVVGRLKLNSYRDRDGKDREQLQIIADAVISARTVRPGGGRRRGDEGSAP